MRNKYKHAMTLRIDEQLDDHLTDASYDAGMSKAAWIRRAIHQSLSNSARPNSGGLAESRYERHRGGL